MCIPEIIEAVIKDNIDELRDHTRDLLIEGKIIEAENIKDELAIKYLEIDELVNRTIH